MNTTTAAGRYPRDRTDDLLSAIAVLAKTVLRAAPDVGLFVAFCVIWAAVFATVLH